MVDSFISNGVAITGGIGCGKSKVCEWLVLHTDFHLVSSDHIVRDLLEVGEPGWQQLYRILGEKFFRKDTSLNKPQLRSAIFADFELKRQVEEVMHPLVFDKIREEAFLIKKETGEWCLIEVPLLYECGWESRFVKVGVVLSSTQICIDRLVMRDNVPASDALAALKAQRPIHEKAELADFVIDNGGEWSFTVEQLVKRKKILDDLKNT